MKFTVGLVQFRPDKGEYRKNVERIAEASKEAVSAGADLVLFGESATTGYILEGGVDELCVDAEQLADDLLNLLKNHKGHFDLVVGFYEKSLERPYNSALHVEIKDGEIVRRHFYRKFFLPTYHVFDEARFHQEGNELGAIETRFGKIGVLICEDVWHSIMGSLLAVAGAHTILVLSASPARGFQSEKPSNLLRYERMLTAMAEEHGLYIAMSMLVGFEGGKGLVGGSLAISPFGETMIQAETMGEQIILAEVDTEMVRVARSQTPLISDLKERWTDLMKLAWDKDNCC
ncbi:nitrilase-related carbon-nitrogen hydrolase [Kamptonema cortianum]|nr:nitrilase-related carbon-nitrogen hydrolase [Geitlerinema splendidum]MDK3162441.1 nitrilase-related carbon-nitrogen hydrolase [Kamptonema cortianum]